MERMVRLRPTIAMRPITKPRTAASLSGGEERVLDPPLLESVTPGLRTDGRRCRWGRRVQPEEGPGLRAEYHGDLFSRFARWIPPVHTKMAAPASAWR